jgi:hypothetical protein
LPITISSGILILLNTSTLSKNRPEMNRYDKILLGVMARFAVAKAEVLTGAAPLVRGGTYRFRVI